MPTYRGTIQVEFEVDEKLSKEEIVGMFLESIYESDEYPLISIQEIAPLNRPAITFEIEGDGVGGVRLKELQFTEPVCKLCGKGTNTLIEGVCQDCLDDDFLDTHHAK